MLAGLWVGFLVGLCVGRLWLDDILDILLGPAELIDELLEKPV